MKRTIGSTVLTFVFKFIFPALWGMIGTLLLKEFFGDVKFWVVASILLIGGLYILWISIHLKAVEVDDNFIYLSNFSKTVKVPLEWIDEVRCPRSVNYYPAEIRFDRKTEFGSLVMFAPEPSLIPLSSHSDVEELKNIVAEKKET